VQKIWGLFVLPPEYCAEEIKRLCRLMPTPEHRVEGFLVIVSSVIFFAYFVAVNNWVMAQVGKRESGEVSAWSAGSLAIFYIAARAAWAMSAIAIVIGLAKLITNE
jgi:ABC-type enterobactin transport system permease subunit